MMFAKESVEAILAGKKTQTRRPVQPGEIGHPNLVGSYARVDTRGGRQKWAVHSDYAINPPAPEGSKARCGKQVGRLKLTGIRCEPVGDISDEDALAEGVEKVTGFLDSISEEERERLAYGFKIKGVLCCGPTPGKAFLKGWKKLYPKSDLSELVWVLEWDPDSVTREAA